MPIEFLYLAAVFVVAIIGFSVLKRPLYECMLLSFVVLIAITNTWSKMGTYIWDALTTSSLYVIIVFIVFLESLFIHSLHHLYKSRINSGSTNLSSFLISKLK